MNYDVNNLPDKRRIDIKYIFLSSNTIGSLGLILFFAIGLWCLIFGINSNDEMRIVPILMGIFFMLFTSILFITISFHYVCYMFAVKTGERGKATITAFYPKKSIEVSATVKGEEIKQALYIREGYLEKCEGLKEVPIFCFKKHIYIDWCSLKETIPVVQKEIAQKQLYFANDANKSLANKAMAISIKSKAKEHNGLEKLFFSKHIIFNILLFATTPLIILAPLLIYIGISQIINHDMDAIMSFGSLFFVLFIMGGTIYYSLPDFIRCSQYKVAIKKGEAIIAYSKIYQSEAIYKNVTKQKITFPNTFDDSGVVLELIYQSPNGFESKNSFTITSPTLIQAISGYGCLTAIYYKNKVYPDLKGIAIMEALEKSKN